MRFPLLYCGVVVIGLYGCGESTSQISAPKVAPATQQSITLGSMGAYGVYTKLERPFYSDHPRAFAFSPDGRTLAAAGGGFPTATGTGGDLRGLIFLYDAQTGAEITRLLTSSTFMSRQPYFTDVIWSPDGKFVAAWLDSRDGYSANPVFVWDVTRKRLSGKIGDARFMVSDVAWSGSGELLISRGVYIPNTESQMLVCAADGSRIRRVVQLESRGVVQIEPNSQGAPRVLVQTSIKDKSGSYAHLRSSICLWRDDSLSAPVVQFPVDNAFLGAAFGKRFVGVSGLRVTVEQGAFQGSSALEAVVDTRKKRVIWQHKKAASSYSTRVVLSPDEKQMWFIASDGGSSSPVNVQTGKSSQNFGFAPLFSLDGKRALHVLNALPTGSQKSHLPIAELLEH